MNFIQILFKISLKIGFETISEFNNLNFIKVKKKYNEKTFIIPLIC